MVDAIESTASSVDVSNVDYLLASLCLEILESLLVIMWDELVVV